MTAEESRISIFEQNKTVNLSNENKLICNFHFLNRWVLLRKHFKK